MINKFKALAAITIFLMLTACSDSVPDTSEHTVSEDKIKNMSEQNIAQTTVQVMPEYKIVEDEVKRNIKRTVEVELLSRTDEESLRALAEKIYALSNVKVERTFMIYRIAGEGDGSAWATSHYDPDLKVDITGASASDYEKIKNTNVSEGEVLGSWMVNRGMDSKTTAYKKDGQVYMQEVYDTGTLPEDKIYELTKLDEGIKLQSEGGKDHGEYFIINKNGDLEFWSEGSGNYYTTTQKV